MEEKSGIGFLDILTLIFVAAKLFGAIDWSWWWVFSPIWIPLLLVTWLCVMAWNWIVGTCIALLFIFNLGL